jgi:hypothetical protein
MTLFDYYFKSFLFIHDISYLVGIIIGIKHLKYFDFRLKLIFVLISVGLLTEIIGFIYIWILKKHNVFIYNSYAILEFGLLSFFYITIINSLLIKRLIMFLLLIFSLISLFDFYTNSDSLISHNKFAALGNFLITCYAICFFIHSLKNDSDKISTKSPLFWINSSILIYYMPFILIFLFHEYLNKISNIFLSSLYHTFNNSLVLVFITFIIIGFLKSKNKNYEIKTE